MNYYEILGVGPKATDQEIKEGYRREAMKWHPDRHEGAAAKGEADRRFKDLAVAYRTLRNPSARADYDSQLEQQLRREYEARQQEQEHPQRAKNERAQRKQTQEKQAPPEQPDAYQMFYEQMLDSAYDLAMRGFPEFNIYKALIALGCPDALAKAVAARATKQIQNKDNAPRAPASPPTEPKHQPTYSAPPKAPNGSGKVWSWIIAIGIVIAYANSGNKTSSPASSSSNTPSYSSTASVPTPTTRTTTSDNAGSFEQAPPVGTGQSLSANEIRYCVSEEIRIEAMKGLINQHSGYEVDQFNATVSDYNRRCSNFRYRRGLLESVKSDVANSRGSLIAEANRKVNKWRSVGGTAYSPPLEPYYPQPIYPSYESLNIDPAIANNTLPGYNDPQVDRQAQSQSKIEYDRTLAAIEARYPELNPDSPMYNSASMNWVVGRKKAYDQGGNRSPTDSLLQAVADYAQSQLWKKR